jgi:tetratricopeptide (TPR) repeat protein
MGDPMTNSRPYKWMSRAAGNAAIMAVIVGASLFLLSTTSVYAQGGATTHERAISSTASELAQRHYRRGNTYNNLERYDEAIEEYRLAVAADPNLADAYRNLANLYLHQERFNEAIPMLARFISLQDQPSTPLTASLKTIGELLRRSERYDESISFDLRAIEADPRDDSQVHIMGNIYDNAGHTDKAIQIYEKAAETLTGNAFMNRTLGRLYEREGRLEDALTQYRKAAATDLGSQFYRELVQNLETRLSQDQQMRGNG